MKRSAAVARWLALALALGAFSAGAASAQDPKPAAAAAALPADVGPVDGMVASIGCRSAT
jgi:hypothetical protein